MNIGKIFSLSYNALKERKVRSVLTIIMVVVGISLMVALNGLVAGFSNFAEIMLDKLAPNVLFVSSTGIAGTDSFSWSRIGIIIFDSIIRCRDESYKITLIC